ncbi:beta strand repeat-containing protein [Nostoc sp. DedQUE07]|uniref:beta strand repeat-containing protein n=1 Tax=Nostoc sp. DedQUE07 TaxID=3075392 RepID=UPI00391907CA
MQECDRTIAGAENLIVRGNLDTNTLLLNTKNITIAENTPDNSQATIYKSTLEGLSENTNLILQATNDITINAFSNNLILANRSDKVIFNADVDGDGIGNFQMQTADTIKTNGGDISISGASLILGNIDTSFILGGGDINLTATEGNISTGNLESYSISYDGRLGESFWNIILDAQGNISTGILKSYSHSHSYSSDGTAGTGGEITLTALGNISTHSLNSFSFSFDNGTAGTGGDITLTAQGNISTQAFNSSSSSFDDGTAGNGGDITLTARGNISTPSLYSLSSSVDGTAGTGGDITLTAQGNISTQSLSSLSSSFDDGTAGNGGDITLTARGNISTQSLDSFSSYSVDGTAGTGGDITLTAQGDIKGIRYGYNNEYEFPVFSSFSLSQNGVSGQGGNVTLTAKNQITDLEILTLSSDFKSGDVQIKGFGDLSLTNTDIITSKQVTIRNRYINAKDIIQDVSGVGQSGNVTVTSTGNLTFNNSRIESDTRSSDPAGNITITSPGTVTFNNNNISKITSNTSSQGKAGNIQINANNLVLTDASESQSILAAQKKYL